MENVLVSKWPPAVWQVYFKIMLRNCAQCMYLQHPAFQVSQASQQPDGAGADQPAVFYLHPGHQTGLVFTKQISWPHNFLKMNLCKKLTYCIPKMEKCYTKTGKIWFQTKVLQFKIKCIHLLKWAISGKFSQNDLMQKINLLCSQKGKMLHQN